MVATLVNIVGFQAGWLGCVLGAAAGWPWIGPVIVATVVTAQAWLGTRPGTVGILAAAAIIGYAADSLVVSMGLLEFPPQAVLGRPSTLWMVALWVNFAATLDVSLHWLEKRLGTACLLGAVGGPLAYEAGRRLGAIEFGAPDLPVLGIVAVEWAIATPALVWLAGWKERAACAMS